jgi:DNA-binding MarR family transcriptional regulator
VTDDTEMKLLDLEAIIRDPSVDAESELRLWLRMLSCTNRVSNEIRARLRVEFNVTLPRFDLLAQLDRETEGLRLGELSRRLMVTNGNITGLVGRLVAEGLVRRTTDADRRAAVVRLTPRGKAAFRKMAQAHDAWLKEMFCEIDKPTRTALMDGLARVKGSVAVHMAEQEADDAESRGRARPRNSPKNAASRGRT